MCQKTTATARRTTAAAGAAGPAREQAAADALVGEARRLTRAERRNNRIERLAGIIGEIFSECLNAMRHEDDVAYVEACLAEIYREADPAGEARRLADEGADLRGVLR